MKTIKFLIMDVDGTLTDGKIYIGNQGETFKAFDIKDGAGIHDLLIPAGITPVILTGRSSEMVRLRFSDLGVTEIYQGVRKKSEFLEEYLQSHNIKKENVAYIGDDINDFECMKSLKENGGLTGCPADAVREIQNICNYICKRAGGNGAVREFIEWILEKNTRLN
ncbi:MAG: HAD-IIIA family hydrolase [Treponema sp.]|nr:HAD-IIIA family hydrolase [Spirochaetia bacterium]MDD7014777.1 HAD-IIIA family hydrolase [Spirochaetales bacterium]MDY4901417.1 HAD-IIIA family hydrolase [Treponema sp.]